MPGLNDIEEVGGSVGVEESERGGLLPRMDPFGIKISRGISLDGRQRGGRGRVCGEVEVVFHG